MYIGNTPQIGQYRKMDALSFDGSTTSFPITVGGTAFTPPTVFAMMVVLNDIPLNPGVDFSIAGSLLDHRSPLDNVALAIVGQKKNLRRETAMHWLQRVGAEHLAAKNTRQLSGGERQRISLARALVNGCTVLLLDEPFTALDRHSRSSLRELVVEIAESENLTAVVVSHDVEDIVAMATKVVLFEPGATVGAFEVERGNPASVLDVLGRQ